MRPRLVMCSVVVFMLAGSAWAQSTLPATRPAADAAEYGRKVVALKEGDIEGRLAVARWARDREMWAEAVDQAKEVLYREPYNRAAYLILQQVDEARPLPAEPRVEAALKREFSSRFGREFKTRSTPHFILCYDTTDAFAAGRGAVMERIYQGFHFYFVMERLRPEFLNRRMVVILLKDREDYLAYLAENERGDMPWSAGFYSQRTNRAMYFDDSSGPTAASYAKQAADLRARAQTLSRQIEEATARGDRRNALLLMQERNRVNDHVAHLGLRAGNAVIMLNNSKSMHEAAHQVSFNIGVQRRLVDYPAWFSEGLACSFETEDALGRKGPAVMNFGRIAGIKEALKADRLVPLETFVRTGGLDGEPRPGEAQAGRGGGERAVDASALTTFYAQSWGLFHYLYKFHRKGMEEYIFSLKALPLGRPTTPEQRLAMFKEAFGEDLEGLEGKFRVYLRSLPAAPQ